MAELSTNGPAVLLPGLDGGTPLGFLAGVGLLRVLADCSQGGSAPALSWRFSDAWRPVVYGPASFDEVADTVLEDARRWEASPLFELRYLKLEKRGPKAVGGLKAPVAVLRRWLEQRRDAGDDASLAAASALMCETANEPADETASAEQLAAAGIEFDPAAPLDRQTLPTYFDFTSRNAQFLEQAKQIRADLQREAVVAGLAEGRGDPAAKRSMDWDPAADTPGAIYTGYTRGFLPVAEWLAFRGLACFPVTGLGKRLTTTGCSGRRLAGEFVWPLWEVPARLRTVASLVGRPYLAKLDAFERQALGIAAMFRAELTKKADGYSGMFAPSEPIGQSVTTGPSSAFDDAAPEHTKVESEPAAHDLATQAESHKAAPTAQNSSHSKSARTRQPSLSASDDDVGAPRATVDWSFSDDE
jgi:hypothetical protein